MGAERAPEYTEPLGGLQRSLKIRIQVAGLWTVLGPPRGGGSREIPECLQDCLSSPAPGIYKGFCLDVIRNKYECELQGARQHLEVCWAACAGVGWGVRSSNPR